MFGAWCFFGAWRLVLGAFAAGDLARPAHTLSLPMPPSLPLERLLVLKRTASAAANVPAADHGFSRHLARLLDTAIRVPGTKLRIGLDPLLGLIAGVGDALAAGL